MPTSAAAGKTDKVDTDDTFRRKKKSPPHTHTRSSLASLLRY